MHVQLHGHSLQLGELHITFHRTLRIPDNGRRYPLPPSLGAFPLRHVDDYRDRVPEAWRERGGVFLPMYQREAMWIAFRGPQHKPRAVQIGVGKVCAITGKPWTDTLSDAGKRGKQNYLVTPPQPWLDGICAGHGTIKQFVAMPLGSGYTVEGQLTGEEKVGGVQIQVFDPKAGRFPDAPPAPTRAAGGASMTETGGYGGLVGASGMPAGCVPPPAPCAAPLSSPLSSQGAGAMSGAAPSRGRSMGLAAGGKMKQKIYPDPHGLDTWDAETRGRCFVHLCNSEMFSEITGEPPPPSPISADSYKAHGLPWYDLYDEHAAALDVTPELASVKSVAELDQSLLGKVRRLVRDGAW